MHLPNNSTTLIQIIGRSLKTHYLKTIANIIIPFSKMDEKKTISNFLKVIASNDSKIKNCYNNKKIGSYISFNNQTEYIENDEDNCNEEECENEEEVIINKFDLKYESIYNSIGICINGSEIWKQKLEYCKIYIDENGKRPNERDKNINIKKISNWLLTQITNYKTKNI